MQEILLSVPEENEEQRLDTFICDQLEDFSRSFIQKLIKEEYIKVNEKKVKANYKIQLADKILINIPQPEPIEIEAEDIPLDIVYEDEDLLVINKPAGMLVHPVIDNTSGTLVNALLFLNIDLSTIAGELRPGIVHRLDRDTSGLLMVAKNDYTHQDLASQLKNQTADRAYLALVHGVIAEPGGIIDVPIGRNPNDRQKRAVTLKNSKEAITKYYVNERFQNNSLVECILKTGRTHQIRVHMSYINHPIVGDLTYGWKKDNLAFNGQALHAYQLGFTHPRTKEKLSFSAPLPHYFENVLSELRREDI